jgi:hypothetical protein
MWWIWCLISSKVSSQVFLILVMASAIDIGDEVKDHWNRMSWNIQTEHGKWYINCSGKETYPVLLLILMKIMSFHFSNSVLIHVWSAECNTFKSPYFPGPGWWRWKQFQRKIFSTITSYLFHKILLDIHIQNLEFLVLDMSTSCAINAVAGGGWELKVLFILILII